MKIINQNTQRTTSDCPNCGTQNAVQQVTLGTNSSLVTAAQGSNTYALPANLNCTGGVPLYQYLAFLVNTHYPVWSSSVLPIVQAQAALALFLNPVQPANPPAQYEVLQLTYCINGSRVPAVTRDFSLTCNTYTPPPNPCNNNADCAQIVCPNGQPAECINGACLCPCDCQNPQCNQGSSCQRNPADNTCYCVPCSANQCYNFVTHTCENCPCNNNADCAQIVCPNGQPAVCVNGVCLCPCNCQSPNCSQGFSCQLNPADNTCYCVPCSPNQCYNFVTHTCEVCPCNNNADCAQIVCPNGQPAVCVNGVCLCPCNCQSPTCSQGSSCQQNPADNTCYCVPCGLNTTYDFSTGECVPNPCPGGATPIIINGNAYCPCNCNAPSCPVNQTCVTNPYDANQCICVPVCLNGGIFNPTTGECQVPCITVTPQFNYTLQAGGITMPAFPVVDSNTGAHAIQFVLTATHASDPTIGPYVWNYPPYAPSTLVAPPYELVLAPGNWTIQISNIIFDGQQNCAIPNIVLSIDDVQPGECCVPHVHSGGYSPNPVYFRYKIRKNSVGGYTDGSIDYYTVVEPDRPEVNLIDKNTGLRIPLAVGPFTGQPDLITCTSNTGYFISPDEFTAGYWHNANQPGTSASPFIYNNTTPNIGNGGYGTVPTDHAFANGASIVGNGRLYFRIADSEFDDNDEALIEMGMKPHPCRLTTVWALQGNCEHVNCTTCGTALPPDECTPISNCNISIVSCDAEEYEIRVPMPYPVTVNSLQFGATNYPAPAGIVLSTNPVDLDNANAWIRATLPVSDAAAGFSIGSSGEILFGVATCQHGLVIGLDTSAGALTLSPTGRIWTRLEGILPAGANVTAQAWVPINPNDWILVYNAASTIVYVFPTNSSAYSDIVWNVAIQGCSKLEAVYKYPNGTSNTLDIALSATTGCQKATLSTPELHVTEFTVTNNGPDTLTAGSVLYIKVSTDLSLVYTGYPSSTNGTAAIGGPYILVTIGTDVPSGGSFKVYYAWEQACSTPSSYPAVISVQLPYTDPDLGNNTATAEYKVPSGDIGLTPVSIGCAANLFSLRFNLEHVGGDSVPSGESLSILLSNLPPFNNPVLSVISGNATVTSSLGGLYIIDLTADFNAGDVIVLEYTDNHTCMPITGIEVKITSFPTAFIDTNGSNDSYSTDLL